MSIQWAGDKKQGVAYMYSARISDRGAAHGFTARHGGVSGRPFDTLNLGWNRPEDSGNIRRNYERLCAAAGIRYESMVLASYCHGDSIEIVHASQSGAGFDAHPLPPCDGLITLDSGVTLVTLHADCMAVFFYDPVMKAVGLCHAGWKGAQMRIGAKMVQKMAGLGCAPDHILVLIGPAICKNCFEVDAPVMCLFQDSFPGVGCIETKKAPKYHIDLPMTMRAQLFEQGVPAQNIESSPCCTYEDEDFFSYRRDGKIHGATGAMAGFIALRTDIPA